MSQPPTVGPIAAREGRGESEDGDADRLLMLRQARAQDGDRAVGISTPPVNPWPARNRISCGSEVESAQSDREADEQRGVYREVAAQPKTESSRASR